jgi:hypothetical protein
MHSWLNLVERFFRDLTDFITEKSFASLGELSDAVIGFLAERNANARARIFCARSLLPRPSWRLANCKVIYEALH